MIHYGLKLWSHNKELFESAVALYKSETIHFIELYFNDKVPLDFSALQSLIGIPLFIHAPHGGNFHTFRIGPKELLIWQMAIQLADALKAAGIIVHPGQAHTFETFKENLALIDDSRILIENMAGLDLNRAPMFGQHLDDLVKIAGLKPICFDFEKAVKAACYQQIAYKSYIANALEVLNPVYFHLSGGDPSTAIDEHDDLWESSIDWLWIKKQLLSLSQSWLVFETPKQTGLENDCANIAYFKAL